MDYGDKGGAGGCVPAWTWYVLTYLQYKYDFSFLGKPLTYWMPFLKFCVEWKNGNIVQNMFPLAVGFGLTVYTVLTIAMFASIMKNRYFGKKLVNVPVNFFS